MNNCYELGLIGVIDFAVEPLSDEVITRCTSFLDALDTCILHSRVKRTDSNLALQVVELARRDGKTIKLSPSQFCRIRHGLAHLNGDAVPYVEMLCSNSAITQWQAKQLGARVEFMTELEVLRRENEVLKRLNAA